MSDNLSASSEPVQDTTSPLDMNSAIAGLSDILNDDDLPVADPIIENEDTEQAAGVEGDGAGTDGRKVLDRAGQGVVDTKGRIGIFNGLARTRSTGRAHGPTQVMSHPCSPSHPISTSPVSQIITGTAML